MIDFSNYIAERTQAFTGRRWVFEAINAWLDDDTSRDFLLTGGPGSGKSAIAARLAQFAEGTAPPPPSCPHFQSGFLSAVHFCSARDQRWINPLAFAESIAHQLAQRYPTFARALAETSGERIQIDVDQRARMVSGQQIGVVIERLDVGTISPGDAFEIFVRRPLEMLFRAKAVDEVVILVDALDEALLYRGDVGIVSLLAHAANRPHGVRFLLTSRREDLVENEFWGASGLVLSAPQHDRRNRKDIGAYVRSQLAENEALKAQAAPLDKRPEWIAAISREARSNFQYVHFLLKEMASGRRPITDFTGLPHELDGLYYQSLKRVVKQLGGNEWSTAYAPILGCLSVAQASLTIKQLGAFTGQSNGEVRRHLGELDQFVDEVPWGEGNELDEEDPVGYELYHQSVVDFLRRKRIAVPSHAAGDGRGETQEKEAINDFCLDAEDWHQAIADAYWSAYRDSWAASDDYGLRNLATHLSEGGTVERLYHLLTQDRMVAQFDRFNSHYAFAADVSTVIDAAQREASVNWVQLIRGSLLYATIGALVTDIPARALGVLARLGRVQQAVDMARLNHDDWKRAQALLVVGEALLDVDPEQATVLLNEARHIASSVWLTSERDRLNGLLAEAHVRSDRYEDALATVQRIDDVHQRNERFTALAHVLVQRQAWTEVLDIATHLDERDIGRRVNWIAAQRPNHPEALDAAEALAQTIQEEFTRHHALGDIALAWIDTVGFDEALGAMQRAPEAAKIVEHLARTLIEAERYDEVHAVVAVCGSDGAAGTVLHTIADGLLRAERFEDAVQVIDTIPEPDWMHSQLVEALGRAGRFDDALASLAALDGDYWQSTSLCAVLRALIDAKGRAAAWDAAVSWSKQLQQGEKGSEGSENSHPAKRGGADQNAPVSEVMKQALALLSVDLIADGRVGDALWLIEQVEGGASQQDALHSVIRWLTETGHLSTALALIPAIDDEGMQHQALPAALTACARRTGLSEEVGDCMNQMADIFGGGGTMDDMPIPLLKDVLRVAAQQASFREAIVPLWVRSGSEVHRVIEVLISLRTSMGDAYEPLLEGVVGALIGAHRWADVHALAQHMVQAEAAERIDRPLTEGEVDILIRVIAALAEAEHYHKALALGDALYAEVETHSIEAAIRKVVVDIVDRHGADAADQMVGEAVDEAHQSSLLHRTVTALVDAGHTELATMLAGHIVESEHQSQALRYVVQALARSGQVKEALSLVDRIRTSWVRTDAVAAVGVAYATAGQMDRVPALVEYFEHAWLKGRMMVHVIDHLVDAEAVGRAGQVADQLLTLDIEADGISEAAESLLAAGDSERAEKLLERVLYPAAVVGDEWTKQDALRTLAALRVETPHPSSNGGGQELHVAVRVDSNAPEAIQHVQAARELRAVGNEEQAARRADQAYHAALRMTSENQNWVTWNVAALLAEMREHARLTEFTTAIQHLEHRTTHRAQLLCEVAHAVAGGQPSQASEASIIHRITDAVQRWKSTHRATRILERAWAMVPDLDEASDQVAVLERVGYVWLLLGKQRNAVRAASQMQAAAERTSDLETHVYGLAQVVMLYCRAQEAAQAAAVLERALAAIEKLFRGERSKEEHAAYSGEHFDDVRTDRVYSATMIALGEALAKMGTPEQVDRFIAVAVEAGPLVATIRLLRMQVMELTRAERHDEAAMVARFALHKAMSADSNDDIPQAMSDVLDVLAVTHETEQVVRALRHIDNLTSEKDRLLALASAARVAARYEWKQAPALIRRAGMLAAQCSDRSVKTRALRHLLAASTHDAHSDQGLLFLCQGLNEARSLGRDAVFQMLSEGGKLLVRLDDGQTVSQVHEAILDVESWWTRPEVARPTASV